MGQIQGSMGNIGSIAQINADWQVLIVDDDPAMQALIADYLSRLGYQTICFGNADEALLYAQKWLQNIPSREKSGCGKLLVISDLHLPHMHGYEFVARLKALGVPMASILMSSFGSEKKRVEALAKGASAYLDKPFGLQELRTAMRDLQRQPLSPT